MTPVHRRRVLQGLMALLAAPSLSGATTRHSRFGVAGREFVLDGRPFQIRSGEMHYPRVPRSLWRERFRQAKALGLNTICTYAFWSVHEPVRGRWDFDGRHDLRAFLGLAAEEGLYTILRPGPYACAEVDFGGLPPWLLATPGMRVRSLDPRCRAASRDYLNRIAHEVGDLQSSRGGSLLMVQLENEYGSFGNDTDYLQGLRDDLRAAGFDLPLYTSNGDEESMLVGGTLPDIPNVVNFGGDLAEAQSSFASLRAFRPEGPAMAGEVWAGWFDHWGEEHHREPVAAAAETVDWMMSEGYSFNLYMFHGGTNFGWLAGANSSREQPYQPTTTSYDYDAPVDEAGQITPKFAAIRAAIARHLPADAPLPDAPAVAAPTACAPFTLQPLADLPTLLERLSTPIDSHRPLPMESYGQSYGLILYRTRIPADFAGTLDLGDVRDEALVRVDGQVIGTVSRRLGVQPLPVQLRAGAVLDILVENCGRIGFGRLFPDERKGLLTGVRLGDALLHDWQVYPLPLTSLGALASLESGRTFDGPGCWSGSLTLARPTATYLDTRGWGRGHVWINDHHLGRFWSIGPQQTLYVPSEWTRAGENRVHLLSLTGPEGVVTMLSGRDAPLYAGPDQRG